MTGQSEKDNSRCLTCNNKVGVSTRTCFKIFGSTLTSSSEKSLVNIISSVLEIELTEDSVHSAVLCKKCYKLFTEFDELETKLGEIKEELTSSYNGTIAKITEESQQKVISVDNEEEFNDHDYLNNADGLESGELRLDPHLTGQMEVAAVVDAQAGDMEDVIEGGEIEEIVPGDGADRTQTDEGDATMDESSMEPEYTDQQEGKRNSKAKQGIKKETTAYLNEGNYVSRDGSIYTCLLCGPEESASGDYKAIIAHVRAVHDAKLYICDVCGQDFKKRNELSTHLDEHVAKEEGDFQCEVCNRIFSNLRLFRIHKRIHYPQAKSWHCETCGKRYSSKNLLDEHINTHTGLRPYICEVCHKDFASKYTYKAHEKTHQVRPRPFACSQCDKSFLSQQNLTQHEKTHNGIKEFVCETCGKAFGSAHNLEVHNVVHTRYKPYVCRTCNKAFARKAEIRDHERTHTGEKPYQCEMCGATFSQRSNLQSHKRATHYNDKRYKCDDCGKGFKRRRLLDYHIKAAHTGERPYKCETCSATFVYPEHFKKHMRIHTGEKPYLCEVCGKAFNSRDNRNAHRFIHSDKKPYECLVCGMGFMRKPLLYTHMQTRGHLNDTIVVNQPRLTTESEGQIIIPEGQVELLMEGGDGDQMEGTQVYVTELKDHVIIQQEDDENIYSIPEEEEGAVDQLVIEGQEDANDQVEEVYGYNSEDGETIVVSDASGLKQMVGDNKNTVRLVQIRLPNSSNADGRGWLSLVQNA